MRVTHKQDKSVQNYSLTPHSECLNKVKNRRDLRITISYDLSWSDHVHDVANRANRVLSVIKRTISPANKSVFSMLSKSLVRPILEYTIPVSCPYLVKDIVMLEKVQQRASRLTLGQKRRDMPYRTAVPS